MAIAITLIICLTIVTIIHRTSLSDERLRRTDLEIKIAENEGKELQNHGEELKIQVLHAELEVKRELKLLEGKRT